MKDLYKIYISTKKKDGTVLKSDNITTNAENKEGAIESVIRAAKGYYGYKGKVHIGSVFIRDSNKKWQPVQ